jgi:hypothetical protein
VRLSALKLAETPAKDSILSLLADIRAQVESGECISLITIAIHPGGEWTNRSAGSVLRGDAAVTLHEAITAFEKGLIICHTPGCEVEGLPGLDMTKAPTGDAYVTLASGGETAERDPMPAWFATEALAVRAWLKEAWAYAESQGGNRVFWRERPILRTVDFVSLDQAGLMADPIMRRNISVRVCTVISRLFVSEGEQQKAVREQESEAETTQDSR